jgi:hypothetical protein
MQKLQMVIATSNAYVDEVLVYEEWLCAITLKLVYNVRAKKFHINKHVFG